MEMTEELKGQLMASGLSKQQVNSSTAKAVVDFLMNADGKALIQEARRIAAEKQSTR